MKEITFIAFALSIMLLSACVNDLKEVDNSASTTILEESKEDILPIEDKGIVFSYEVSVSKWESGELPEDKIGEKDIDLIIDEYRNSFNTITINGNNVNLRQLFDKSNPCTSVNYTIEKNDFEVNIIPKKIPKEPKYDPETGEKIIIGCVQIVATDLVEINLTLDRGNYIINLFNYWDSEKPFRTETVLIQ